jgi:hypothetical protein
MTSFPLLSCPPPVVGHESALFNPRVVIGGEDQATATAAAYTTSSNGRQVRVSVRLHPPPAESYVHMQTQDTLHPHGDPSVLAACGDLLLVNMIVRDDAAADLSYKLNLFVYKAHPARPWLRRLPNPDTFPGWDKTCGVVPSDDDGGFVVASFRIFKNLETAQEVVKFLRYSSATDRWDLTIPPMPYDGDALRPHLWETDKVFSSPDGKIYWVDYHRGLLVSQVLIADDNPRLRFIQLPGIEIWTTPCDFCYGRLEPEASRTVGVCKGVVKFVDIDSGFFGSIKKSGFTVTVWTLRISELKWDQVSTLQVDDLWALANFQAASLPRWVPQFPLVSTTDVHALHFIQQERESYGEDWIITVNMHDKVLQLYDRRIETSSNID